MNETLALVAKIQNKSTKQKDVITDYAHLIYLFTNGLDIIDFGRINRAIIARWSTKGLENIKKAAWKVLE